MEQLPFANKIFHESPNLNIVEIENFWNDVRFELFAAVTMKNGVFWDVTPCEPHGVTSQKTPFIIRSDVRKITEWEDGGVS
jgi:hypothetical protein